MDPNLKVGLGIIIFVAMMSTLMGYYGGVTQTKIDAVKYRLFTHEDQVYHVYHEMTETSQRESGRRQP